MAFLELSCFGLLALQGGNLPSTAEYRWARQGIAMAVKEGILPEYQYGIYRVRIPDIKARYEFAVYLHSAVVKQLEKTETALDSGASDVDYGMLNRAQALLPFYRRGAKEFSKELRLLGIESDFGIDRLATLSRRLERQSPARTHLFSDVPADHWAAKAVGDLRALGLLDGYPDGRFRG